MDNIKLGKWDEDLDELRSKSVSGTGLYANISEETDFFVQASRLLKKELLKLERVKKEEVVYIVLAGKEIFSAVRPTCKSVPMLRSNSRSCSLFGNLWFVPRTLGHGFAYDASKLTVDDVFETVKDFGAGECPIILLNTADQGELFFYRDGVNNAECVACINIFDNEISSSDIDDALTGLYNVIKTPDQIRASSLWEKTERWIPVKKTEEVVQENVIMALAGRFVNYDIRSEQPSTIGRTDVEIVETQGLEKGTNIKHALLELKVLRSFTSMGKPVPSSHIKRHIREGVRQASQYGKHNNSKHSFLCCYDMRSRDEGDENCFSEVKHAAEERGVYVRRYYLYNKSKHLRQALEDKLSEEGLTPLKR